MAFSLLSAFVLIFFVALSAFLYIFESNALLLNYVKSFVDLMEYKFVWLWVGDTLCRIGYYIRVVVVNDVIWKVLPEVYAKLRALANAGVDPNTAVPPALTAEQAAMPQPDINMVVFGTGNVQDGSVPPFNSPRGRAPEVPAPVVIDLVVLAPIVLAPAVSVPAVSVPAVQPNNTETAKERLRLLQVEQDARKAVREAREAAKEKHKAR